MGVNAGGGGGACGSNNDWGQYEYALGFGHEFMNGRPGGADILADNGVSGVWLPDGFRAVQPTPDPSQGANALRQPLVCFHGGLQNFDSDLAWIESRPGRQVDISFAMIPPISSSVVLHGDQSQAAAEMKTGAGGGYDSYWKLIGQSLVNSELGNAIIRPGWEAGANWFIWSAYVAGEAVYAQYFKRIVEDVHSVAPHVQIAWDVDVSGGALSGHQTDRSASGQSDGAYSDQAYPGDRYLDYIDMDIYNAQGTPSMVDTFGTANERDSVAWWANYAAQHGKYLGFTEWANECRGGTRNAVDSPQFIQNMWDFVSNQANRVAYNTYFEQGVGGCKYGLDGTPKAAAKYEATFGQAPEGVLPVQSSN